jgi:hypothetical protein
MIKLIKKTADAIEAFTDPEGNMPANTGEFNDLKKVLSELKTVLEKHEPTDEDIISLAYDCNALPEVITDASLLVFARALLERSK